MVFGKPAVKVIKKVLEVAPSLRGELLVSKVRPGVKNMDLNFIFLGFSFYFFHVYCVAMANKLPKLSNIKGVKGILGNP